MKKIFCVFMLTLVCAVLFAEQKVAVTFKPYTFQVVTGKNIGDAKSTYGIGGGLGYSRNISDTDFLVGADIYADTYFLEDRKNLTNVAFMGKVGYGYNLNEKMTPYGYLKYGLDLQLYDGITSAVQVFGLEAGGSYRINEKLSATASVGGLFSFPRKDGNKYASYRVNTILGLIYAL